MDGSCARIVDHYFHSDEVVMDEKWQALFIAAVLRTQHTSFRTTQEEIDFTAAQYTVVASIDESTGDQIFRVIARPAHD